jgi:hypothetical protein
MGWGKVGWGKVGVGKREIDVHITYICHLLLSNDPLLGNLEFPTMSKTPHIQLRKMHQPQFYPRDRCELGENEFDATLLLEPCRLTTQPNS